jgi:hypothetical protein
VKPVGIFSERDFINAIARGGATVPVFAMREWQALTFSRYLPRGYGYLRGFAGVAGWRLRTGP